MAAKKTAKKATKKVAKKAPAKKAAKKGAKRAYKVRVTNPNFEKKQRKQEVECCAMEARQPTPEEEAYENGKRHALSENKMVSTAAQLSGVRNNLKWAEKEQVDDEANLAHIQARMVERGAKIQQMRRKVDELSEALHHAVSEATR
jgi:phosphoenolpyruvate carboxylase